MNELEDHPNIKFMSDFERSEHIAKSHSAIITAKRCLRKYFYSKVLRRVLKEQKNNLYLAWGSCYHLFREVLSNVYDELNDTGKYNKEASEIALATAFKAATIEFHKYPFDLQAQGSRTLFMTAERFMRTCKVAYNYWDAELQQGITKDIANEQFVNVELEDTGYYISGVLDKATLWNNEEWVRDYKTTTKPLKSYERTLKVNDQFTRYTYIRSRLAQKPIQGVIVEVMWNYNDTKKEQKGPEIFRPLATRTGREIEDWIQDELFWRETLERCRDLDIWPKSEVGCNYCEYFDVCSRSSERGQVHALKQLYQIAPTHRTEVESLEKGND